MRVAIIGAGAAGFSVLRLIPKEIEENGEIVCFESSNCYGGQWCQYEPKSVEDEDPSSSMYKNLVTNLPTCLMQFPDYEWKHPLSFVHHTDVAKYLMEYCDRNNLQKHVQLNRKVTHLSRNAETNNWNLWSEDKSGDERKEAFDYVFVCSGHFTFPRKMEVPGLDQYPGKVFHSRWFDDPADYKDQTVLVVGKGLSGIDICCELIPHCKKIFVTSYTPTKYFERYDSVHEVSLVIKYENGAFHLRDGTRIQEHIDAVILCTGFTYDLPFMDYKSSGIETEDGYLGPLLKYTVHAKHPSLFFIGLNQRICPFTLFYYQSAFCWSIVTGALKLPNNLEEIAQEEIAERLAAMRKKHFFHLSFTEEQELVSYFAEAAGAAPPPEWLGRVRAGVADQRIIDPVQYKKHQITVSDDKILFSDHNGELLQKLC